MNNHSKPNFRKVEQIMGFMSAIPYEIATDIVSRLPFTSIRKCMKINRTWFALIKQNYLLWHSKCKIKLKDESVKEIKRLVKREYYINKSWTDGKSVENIIFETKQTDITHLQVYKKTVTVSSDDQTIKMYTINDFKQYIFSGHSGGVWAFKYNGNVLVSGSTDRTLRIWNLEFARCDKILKGHKSTVRTISLSEDYIVSGGRDGDIRVWDMDGLCLNVLKGHTESVRSIDLYGVYLISGSYDGSVLVWDISSGTLLRRLLRHSSRVYSVVITKRYFISCGQDSEIHLSSRKMKKVFVFKIHRSVVTNLCIFFDTLENREKYLAASGMDGVIGIWEMTNGTLMHKIVEEGGIVSMKIYRSFLIVALSTKVKIYDVETGGFIRTVLENANPIYKVDVDDDILAIGYKNEQKTYISVFNFRINLDKE